MKVYIKKKKIFLNVIALKSNNKSISIITDRNNRSITICINKFNYYYLNESTRWRASLNREREIIVENWNEGVILFVGKETIQRKKRRN